jgi:hypothetical protein
MPNGKGTRQPPADGSWGTHSRKGGGKGAAADPAVLPGPQKPYWGCPGCGFDANWACRIRCRDCEKQAPSDRVALARRQAKLAREGAGKAATNNSDEAKQLQRKLQQVEKEKAKLAKELADEKAKAKGGDVQAPAEGEDGADGEDAGDDEEDLKAAEDFIKNNQHSKGTWALEQVEVAKAKAASIRAKKRNALPAHLQLKKADQALQRIKAARDKTAAALEANRKAGQKLEEELREKDLAMEAARNDRAKALERAKAEEGGSRAEAARSPEEVERCFEVVREHFKLVLSLGTVGSISPDFTKGLDTCFVAAETLAKSKAGAVQQKTKADDEEFSDADNDGDELMANSAAAASGSGPELWTPAQVTEAMGRLGYAGNVRESRAQIEAISDKWTTQQVHENLQKLGYSGTLEETRSQLSSKHRRT